MGKLPGWLMQIALVVAMGSLVGCPMVPSPAPQAPGAAELEVFPSGFSFESTLTEDFFTISNTGGGNLAWTITTEQSWISFSATQGTATSSAPSQITLTVDPVAAANAKQTNILGRFLVTTAVGSVEVPVAIRVGTTTTPDPSLQVSTTALDFGNSLTTRQFSISNGGPGSFFYTTSTPVGSFISSVQPANGSITSNSEQVTVAVNRDGRAPGTYTDTLTIDAGSAGIATIDVTMSVGDAAPVLAVSPTSLDFGETTSSLSFNIMNGGGGSLDWTAVSDQAFASLSSGAGSTLAGGTNGITVTVDRSALTAGNHTATITVMAGALTETVSISVDVVDAALVVTPTTLSFGNAATTRLITITNPGVGTLNWNIGAISQPWITINPNSGTVTTEADALIVEIDRTLIPPGVFNESFVIESANPGIAPVTVVVTGVFLDPVAEVVSGILDSGTGLPLTNDSGEPVIELGTTLEEGTFTITNIGNGFLNWNIDNTQTPPWLLISRVSGTLGEGASETVTVSVDRDLQAGAYFHEIPIVTNAGTFNLEVGMTISGRIEIVTDATSLSLGLYDNVTSFQVANNGDPETVLNFVVENDREWLFHSPNTGFSIGVITPLPFKDWRTIDVSIDRGELDGTGGTGVFNIYAVDDEGEVISNIEPKQVLISVEAAALTFEQSLAQLRIPSIARFTFNMRDIQYDTFDIDASTIPTTAFQIFENNVALEISETNQFLDNAVIGGGLLNTGRGKVRTNLLVVLDFSGSTKLAADNLGQDLQVIYRDLMTTFLNNLLPTINVGVAEFHDRGQTLRVITPFTQDHADIITDLNGNLGIADNGSTNLFTNLADASTLALSADGFSSQNSTAQVTGVIVLSDGRVTTPPGDVNELIDATAQQRVRYYTVPFGENPNNQILSQLASGTGGHHYNVRQQTNGMPDLAAIDSIMAELAIDMQRFIVLNYATLSEENGVAVRVNAAVDIPNDGRGAVGGTFEQALDYEDIIGDVRMGQISLEASPQANGEIVVRVRSDYMPANVDKFSFAFDATAACSPSNAGGITFDAALVPTNEGGLIGDWTPDAANPAGAVSSGVYRFDAPVGQPARYADFGDILELTFPVGTPTPFFLCFTIDNTIYNGDADQKYFIAPTVVFVDDALTFAPSFPAPRMDADGTTDAIENTVALGNGVGTLTVDVANLGGRYGVSDLYYEITTQPDFLNFDDALTGNFGNPAGTILNPDELFFTVERDGDPGSYLNTLEITWTGTPDSGLGLNIGGTATILVSATIDPPQLGVSSNAIDFGNAGDTEELLTVSNIGQSTMSWFIVEPENFPTGFTAAPTSGTVSSTNPDDEVTLSLDRSDASPGAQNFDFTVRGSNGDVEVVNVQAVIANPVLTPNTNSVDFGTAFNSIILEIRNTGESTLNWTIDDSGFPAWLSVSVPGGQTQTEVDNLGITVDRSGQAAGVYNTSFDIVSDGGTQTINVRMEVL